MEAVDEIVGPASEGGGGGIKGDGRSSILVEEVKLLSGEGFGTEGASGVNVSTGISKSLALDGS